MRGVLDVSRTRDSSFLSKQEGFADNFVKSSLKGRGSCKLVCKHTHALYHRIPTKQAGFLVLSTSPQLHFEWKNRAPTSSTGSRERLLDSRSPPEPRWHPGIGKAPQHLEYWP